METVVEIAECVLAGRVTARAVVERALERIARLNGRLNAFVHVDVHGALEQADAVDRRLAAGERLGPLTGVPFGVKDTHRCAGLPLTYGSVLHRDAPPATKDETFIARLRRAGAIPVGMTAMPEFGMDSSTRSRLWGTTLNPWDVTRTPGGSSGGSAAAVSAGLVPFATAADSAGSTRSPAAFTGTVGMLASHGRVPNADGFDDMTGNGVIATSVRDVARLLDVMQGPHACDRTSLPEAGSRFEDRALNGSTLGLRTCFSEDLGFAVVDPEVVALARRGADRLVAAGGLVGVPYRVNLPDVAGDWLRVAVHRIRVGLEVMGALPDQRHLLSDNLQRLCDRWGGEDERSLYAAGKAVRSIEVAVAECFQSVDIILSPSTACAAFPAEWSLLDIRVGADERPASAEPFGFFANACWLPSISVPVGVTSRGWPVGLLITGRRFADDVVLRLAGLLEEVAPWRRHAPAFVPGSGS